MIEDDYVFYPLFIFIMIMWLLFWIYSRPDCRLEAYIIVVDIPDEEPSRELEDDEEPFSLFFFHFWSLLFYFGSRSHTVTLGIHGLFLFIIFCFEIHYFNSVYFIKTM